MKNSFYGMYAFNSEAQADDKIAVFKDSEKENFIPNTHHIVKRGYLILEAAEYNEYGEETKAVVVDPTHFLVDVIWRGIEVDEHKKGQEPYGWKTYGEKPKTPSLVPLWGHEFESKMED